MQMTVLICGMCITLLEFYPPSNAVYFTLYGKRTTLFLHYITFSFRTYFISRILSALASLDTSELFRNFQKTFNSTGNLDALKIHPKPHILVQLRMSQRFRQQMTPLVRIKKTFIFMLIRKIYFCNSVEIKFSLR